MARRNIDELVEYLTRSKNAVEIAYVRSLVGLLSIAEAKAKRNATKQFIGRNGRKLSGRLLNSIYTMVDFNRSDSLLPVGVLGTRGIPYGRIHEYGGEITPKKAKNLWVKQWGGRADKFRRLTPTEFIKLKKENPDEYKIFRSKKNNLIAAYTPAADDVVPLFVLRQRVEIPKRPYLAPALQEALQEFPERMNFNIRSQLKRL